MSTTKAQIKLTKIETKTQMHISQLKLVTIFEMP